MIMLRIRRSTVGDISIRRSNFAQYSGFISTTTLNRWYVLVIVQDLATRARDEGFWLIVEEIDGTVDEWKFGLGVLSLRAHWGHDLRLRDVDLPPGIGILSSCGRNQAKKILELAYRKQCARWPAGLGK